MINVDFYYKTFQNPNLSSISFCTPRNLSRALDSEKNSIIPSFLEQRRKIRINAPLHIIIFPVFLKKEVFVYPLCLLGMQKITSLQSPSFLKKVLRRNIVLFQVSSFFSKIQLQKIKMPFLENNNFFFSYHFHKHLGKKNILRNLVFSFFESKPMSLHINLFFLALEKYLQSTYTNIFFLRKTTKRFLRDCTISLISQKLWEQSNF